MKRILPLTLCLAAVVACAVFPRVSAKAQPSGKTWTSEITVAGGLVAYFLVYESALLRSKGSVKQAEAVMDATTDTIGGPSGALSLNKIRGLVIADVARQTENQGAWRAEFESFRACWNNTLAVGANSSSQANPPAAASSPSPDTASAKVKAQTSGASDSEGPTFVKPSCDELLRILKVNKILTPTGAQKIDLQDLLVSLAGSPSLLAQVQNQDVGSHTIDNYNRARFLTIAGEDLTQQLTGVTKHTFGSLSDIQGFIDKCLTNLSPSDCIAKFSDIEGAFETAQKRRDSCSWDRRVWMPSYSAIRLWASPGNLSASTFVNPLDHPPGQFAIAGVLSATQYVTSADRAAVDSIDFLNLETPPGC